MRTRPALLLLLLSVSMSTSLTAQRAKGSFEVIGDQFLRDGKPTRIFSGEIHYPRVPREYWKDRLLKARAMGLNTVCTYIFWNAHEPRPGIFDFAGDLDVAAFVRTAQDVGLQVIIRPGPYVCSEWDLGGLPSWLLKEKDIKLRCSDPRFISAVDRYFRRLFRELAPLQITNGGPIILFQVENEYGSYGNDKEYLKTLESIMRREGLSVPFFTSDGGADYLLKAGTLPNILPVVNFGGGAQGEFAALEKFRQNIPMMNGEFWCGWFTHWGDAQWGTSNMSEQAIDLRWMLETGKSFNLYMFHGGTNFGWTAGANYSNRYEPDVTSYDYDAPLNERGVPTAKYFAIRDLLAPYVGTGSMSAPLPKEEPTIQIPAISLTSEMPLFDRLPKPVRLPQPRSMEEVGQDYGFILYRTRLVGPTSGTLTVTEPHDIALVFVDGILIDTLDRTKGKYSVKLPETATKEPILDILVEAMGRVNFGQQLIDRKGITERVTLRGITLMNWEVYRMPMSDKDRAAWKFGPITDKREPKVFRGTFEVENLGDTFLDMAAWSKGVVWVNGRNLGRYWSVGPQQRLYVPGPWLKKGKNEVLVFDLFASKPQPLRGVVSMTH